MHRWVRVVAVALATATTLALAVTASGQTVGDAVSTFTYTKNMKPQGYSARVVPLTGTGSGVFNSDLAFWGKTAVQGTYAGFRIIDIADPENPVQIVNYENCVSPTSANGSQGDVVVYGDVLVRSWDAPRAATAPRNCGEVETPPLQEGVHVFDISDPLNPVAVKFIQTPCGSHTSSAIPDLANNRLLVYSHASSGAVGCRGFDIIEVPLDDLAASSYLRFEPSGDAFTGLPNFVTVDGLGTFAASASNWHPDPTVEGVSGPIALVNSGFSADFPAALPTEGCGPLVGFPAGAIALVDRGTCTFLTKVHNAQDAGAIGVIVANNVAGTPGAMGGDDHTIIIPSAMVSLADGTAIKAALPATGRIHRNPAAENIDRACHDMSVILGDAMMVACAGGNGVSAWSLDPAEGGSLEDPAFMYSMNHGTGIGHTAAFTWDGKYIIFGHEPGGGSQAQCQATSSIFNRTIWFLEAETGETVGEFVHPRPQTAQENCTWHNVNVVPTDKRYVFVSGNYQSGISVVDFTDPANAKEIAFADPAPLSPTSLILGGDWSTYWYNGRIYESDIKRGLIIWNLTDPAVAGAMKFGHLNPQTLETSFPFKGTASGTNN
jgi:PA domain